MASDSFTKFGDVEDVRRTILDGTDEANNIAQALTRLRTRLTNGRAKVAGNANDSFVAPYDLQWYDARLADIRAIINAALP